MNTLQTTIKNIRKELSAAFVERDEIIGTLLTCIIAKQHGVMIGTPGIAKSALVAKLVARFVGAKLFKKLLRRDSTSEEVLGPLSIKGLENDEYRRLLDGFIPAAEIAALEEVFKCNSTVLNGILDIINERSFDNGSAGQIDCPLMSLFGTSNEEPQSEDLQAFWDRFLVRLIVQDIQEDSAFESFLDIIDGNAAAGGAFTFSTLDDLKKAQEEAAQVRLSPEAKKALVSLRNKLRKTGIKPSPRRFTGCVSYLRAVAWLDGRQQIEVDDLMELTNCLWEKQDQIPEVARILGETASPELGKIIELLDACKQAYDKGKGSSDATEQLEVTTKLRAAKKELETIAKRGGNQKIKTKAEEAVEAVKSWHNKLLENLGMSAM